MDEKIITEFGIDGFTLMEIAGTRAADFIQTSVPENSHALFFCGKGNNAGDALVVARLLSQQDYVITVCFLSGTDSLSADTQKNFELLQKLEADITVLNWEDFKAEDYDFIVDGMMGTGLNSDVRAPYSEAIDWINQQEEIPVFALDIPTGLQADTGQIMGTVVQADFTLTFGTLKTGFYLNKGFDVSGEVVLCDLPFPNKYRKAAANLIDRSWVDANSADPKKQKHKYEGGVLYVIAGSEGLTGAAILVAKSAWSAGLGAVIIITPKGLLEIYEKNLVQIIKKPVGNATDFYFRESHLQEVQDILAEKPGKLVIGPGLGRKKETINFTQQLLKSYEGDAVIDADALFALSKSKDWQRPKSSSWILTPHPGELHSLLDSDVSDGYERMIQVSKSSKEKEVFMLSKGLPSILGTVSGDIYLTGYDTRIFSRAGFGDVMAGKIGAFWLKFNFPDLACLHALLNGYEKSIQYFESNSGSLEPLNII